MKAPRPIQRPRRCFAGIQRLCSASTDLSRMAPARPTALPSRGLTLDAQHQGSIVESNPHFLNKWLLRADLLRRVDRHRAIRSIGRLICPSASPCHPHAAGPAMIVR